VHIIHNPSNKPETVIMNTNQSIDKCTFDEILWDDLANSNTFLERIPVPLLLYDEPTRVILAVNQATIDLHGYDREDFIGMHIDDILAEGERSRLFQDLRNNGKYWRYCGRWNHSHKDGKNIVVEVKTKLMQLDGGAVGLSVLNDIAKNDSCLINLAESEARFRSLANHAKDMVFCYEITPQRRFSYVNPAVKTITGYTPEEYYADPDLASKLIHPEDRNLIETMENIKPNGSVVLRLVRKDGKTIWTEQRNFNRYNEEGNIVAVDRIALDITEQKQTEDALRNSEQKYQEIFNGVRDAIFVTSLSGEILEVNSSACEMFGYNRDDFIGNNFTALTTSCDPTVTVAEDTLSFHTQFLELSFTRASGKTFPVSLTFKHRVIGDNPVMLVVVRDITDRKKAEDTLRASERKFRSLVQTSGAGIATLDQEGTIIFVNQAFLSMVGFNEREIIGNPICKFIHPNDAERIYTEFQEVFSKPDKLPQLEFRLCHKDGHVLSCFTHPTPIVEQGVVSGLNAILIDISDRKRIEQVTARQLEELKYLNIIAVACAKAKNVDDLLESIMQTINNTVFPDTYGVYLFDEVQGVLKPHPTYVGTPWEINNAVEIPLGKGIVGQVGASQKPLYVPDVTRYPEYLKVDEYTRSELCVPIQAGERLLGVINVESAQVDDFNEDEERLLVTIAGFLATSIERIRLFEEAHKRADEFAGLYDIARDLSAQNDLQTLLDTISIQAARLSGVPGGAIYLFHRDQKILEVAASTHHALSIGTKLEIGDGVAGRVASTLQPLVIQNYQSWEHRSKINRDSQITSVLEVPMLYGGDLIGVLVVIDLMKEDPSIPIREFTDTDTNLLSLLANIAAGAVYSARLFDQTARYSEQLSQRVNQLSALHDIDTVINSSTELHISLNIILESLKRETEIDAANVLVLDADTMTLETTASIGFSPHVLRSTSQHVHNSLAEQAIRDRKIIQEPNLHEYSLLNNIDLHPAYEAFICFHAIPLISKGETIGVLEIFHRSDLDQDPERLQFYETLAGRAATAIDNWKLFDGLIKSNAKLKLAYDATIEGWSYALELRDRETEGHAKRVTELTVNLAQKMGVKNENLIYMRWGALLHDIGKMGVPDHILHKPGPLSEEEWEMMRKHPLFAKEMLDSIAYLGPAIDIPYNHHEKWDGSGYPRGLKRDEIPLAARIFSIIDVWDALNYDRPYGKAVSHDKVLTYIQNQSGKHFDPQIVKVFISYINEIP